MDARLLSLLDALGLKVEHSDRALSEAEAMDAGADDPALEDLTGLPFVTIDEATSRDLDQALFIEPAGGGQVVWYALADASWFVRPGSAIYDEALQRGASYYLPGLVAPMLPRVLSEDRCSLSAGVDRRALVFRMELDDQGECTCSRITRARVRSRAKLHWEQVQAFYDGGASPCPQATSSLRQLAVVGRRRLALAEAHNVVRFRRQEVDVKLEGLRFVATRDLRLDVERYNEQLSLLCNTRGALFLQEPAPDGLVQPIYRVHDPPQPERLARLQRQVNAIADAHGLSAGWRWDGRRLGAWLDGLPSGPVAAAIHRQALMTSGTASFTGRPGPHHGIGAEAYARFSAPMREIVGVFLHDETIEKLQGHENPVPPGFPDDETLRARVIAASNLAHKLQKQLDRGVNRLVLDQVLGGASGPLEGVVMGLDHGKVHVLLDRPAVDLKIYERHLGWGRLEEEHGVVLKRGRRVVLRAGDRVRVTVQGHDRDVDRWRLGLERQ